MIRKIVLVAFVLFAGFKGCESINTRTKSIPLGESGLTLTYSLTWGWGMEQMICLSVTRCWPWSVASPQSQVWEKPSHANAPVYMSADGLVYYVGHNWGGWRVSISDRTIEHFCDFRRVFKKRAEKRKAAVPFALAKDGPPASLLFENLKYVGVFSVVYRKRERRGRGRGSDVAFFSPQQWPEGEGASIGSCG